MILQDLKQNNNVNTLFSIFKKYKEQLYIIGGASRNIILNMPLKDIDFCTTSKPENTITILKENNINFLDYGKNFGTIVALLNNNKFEITTLRKDIYTKSRYPNVEFIKDIQKDAFRRDFTMNSIYIDADFNIYDFFNGIEDLKNKTVKFIGNTENSIKNDPLRILRYFRFICEYNLINIDTNTFEICLKNFDKIFTLSKRKVIEEYLKIIKNSNKNIVLDKWADTDILFNIKKFIGY